MAADVAGMRLNELLPRQAKIARIADTLSLEHLELSEVYGDLLKQRSDLETVAGPQQIEFDSANNLRPLAACGKRSSCPRTTRTRMISSEPSIFFRRIWTAP